MIQCLTRWTKGKWAFVLTKRIHWISWSWVTDEQILTKWFTDSDLLTCWLVERKIHRLTWWIRKAQISTMTKRFTDSVTDSLSNKWMNLRLDQNGSLIQSLTRRMKEKRVPILTRWFVHILDSLIHTLTRWMKEVNLGHKRQINV